MKLSKNGYVMHTPAHKRSSSTHGFTIVELLIVVVVIGVLAAIVIVAYNGISQRASNTQRTSAAKDWQKLITVYTSQNSAYPPSAVNNHYCLGTGNFTDFDANADEDCFVSTNIKHPASALNAAFETLAKLPSFPAKKINTSSNVNVSGISLRSYDSLDPGTPSVKTQYPMLHFWLEGNNQDCILRPVAQQVAGGYTISSSPFTVNDGVATRCVILLPDPNGL